MYRLYRHIGTTLYHGPGCQYVKDLVNFIYME